MRRAPLPAAPLIRQRRVVVTGLGCVSPLGSGTQLNWTSLLGGRCGIRRLDDSYAAFPTRLAGCVPRGTGSGEFDLASAVGRAGARSAGVDFIGFALQAAAEALSDAGLDTQGGEAVGPYSRDRFGVSIGSGIGCVEDVASVAQLLAGGVETGLRRVSPFFVPRILVNMAGGNVSIRHGLRGPNHASATACATGAHAIGDAFRFIKYGDADAMLAGGTEASVGPVAFAGFCRAKAMASRYNDVPEAASRPFDSGRDGFVLGEGAGVLVLEEAGAAAARGARAYAEVRGYGLSGDAFHLTAPREDGSGALRCMRAALAEAGLRPEHVDYVNAHATSTPLGDAVEALALGALFGSPAVAQRLGSQQQPCAHAGGEANGREAPAGGADYTTGADATARERRPRVAVSSTKGSTGHMLGAAGAVESIFSVLAIHTGTVPPTLNLTAPDASLPTDVCEFVSAADMPLERPEGVRVAINNSFGFGGTNCSLLFASVPSTAMSAE